MVEHNPKCTLHRGEFACTPLHTACSHGHLNVVEVLMDHTQLNKNFYRKQLKATSKHLQTPLHLAAKYGYVDIVEYLLEKSSTLKIEILKLKNKFNGETPVHVAALKGRLS